MKKLGFFTLCAFATLLFVSCNKTDYTSFIGTWGVEKIVYYNIDYAGNPIPASMSTYTFDPNDTNNGIHLVFKEDKTGEMRDSAVDTVWLWNSETNEYDSYIYNPDTTLVNTFTYSYDNTESILYMNVKYTYPYEYIKTHRMKVSNLTHDSFTYENEYLIDYVEKASMKRISDTPTKSTRSQTTKHPNKPGSLLGSR